MNDKTILEHITDLVEEEKRLRQLDKEDQKEEVRRRKKSS